MNIQNYQKKYKVISVCAANPSWYSDFYGNMMLISNSYLNYVMNVAGNHVFGIDLCNLEHHRCFLNQLSVTYNNVPLAVIKTANDNKLLKYDSLNEIKCYIKISLPDFDIVCIHLDAYNDQYRKDQLTQIHEKLTRLTFILRDFNFSMLMII